MAMARSPDINPSRDVAESFRAIVVWCVAALVLYVEQPVVEGSSQ